MDELNRNADSIGNHDAPCRHYDGYVRISRHSLGKPDIDLRGSGRQTRSRSGIRNLGRHSCDSRRDQCREITNGPDDSAVEQRRITAVKWYQRKRGLTVDGFVGPITWGRLFG